MARLPGRDDDGPRASGVECGVEPKRRIGTVGYIGSASFRAWFGVVWSLANLSAGAVPGRAKRDETYEELRRCVGLWVVCGCGRRSGCELQYAGLQGGRWGTGDRGREVRHTCLAGRSRAGVAGAV